MNDVSMSAMPQVSPVGFAGRPGFIRLLLKNALLSVVTLGFYRFWARTAVRRALWNNIVIGGEPLEYTGRGIELFIGFLIAMAIIAPMAAIYGVIQYLFLVSPAWAVGAQMSYFAIIGVLIQVAIFRARRYRLSRTQWRGIRCWQDGSSWRYVSTSLLYGLLSFVTLGLALPWMSTALQRYKIEHTIFGNRRFRFTGTGRRLFLRWLVVYALGALPVLIFLALNSGVWSDMFDLLAQGDIDEEDMKMLGAQIGGWWLLPFVYIGGSLAWVWYRVAEFRYFAANTQFGAAQFRSSAKMSRFVMIGLGYFASLFGLFIVIGLIVVAAGVAWGLVFGGDAKLDISSRFWTSLIPLAVVVIVYILNHIVVQFFMTYLTLRHLCETMEIANLASVESVVQSKDARPRYGEGLADAFDLGAV